MKTNSLMLSSIAAFAGVLPVCQADVSLGSAGSFAVLGGTSVSSTGFTVLDGNLGVSPGATVTGFPPGVVNGTTYVGDSVAAQAHSDAQSAYNAAASLTANQSLSGQNLGGLTLTPGVYNFATTAALTGTLTLNAEGNPNAQFIFQIGSALNTTAGASVVLENAASAGEVFWQVGTAATLGADTAFDGDILSDQTISVGAGASLSGSAVALNGAITLSDNLIKTVPVPEPNSGFSATLCAAVLGLGWRLTAGRKGLRKPAILV